LFAHRKLKSNSPSVLLTNELISHRCVPCLSNTTFIFLINQGRDDGGAAAVLTVSDPTRAYMSMNSTPMSSPRPRRAKTRRASTTVAKNAMVSFSTLKFSLAFGHPPRPCFWSQASRLHSELLHCWLFSACHGAHVFASHSIVFCWILWYVFVGCTSPRSQNYHVGSVAVWQCITKNCQKVQSNNFARTYLIMCTFSVRPPASNLLCSDPEQII
jgi:hypothetical protein